MKKNQKVVIIGHGYTSRLCVIRSVAQLGCDITVVVIADKKKDGSLNTKKPIDCYSKYVNRVLYCENNTGMLIRLLLDECVDLNQKVVLFPDNDFAVVAVDSNKDQLKDFFLFPFINKDQDSIVDWMNKEKQKALAHEVGLNIVESKSIEVKDGNFSIPSVINYPCFTKTRAYIQGTKKTLKRCNNEIELRDFLRDLGTKFDLTLLVEDYKEIDKEYAIVGFSDGNRVVIPGIIQLLNIAHGSHFGVACRGKVMPIDGFEKIVTKFKQFILKIGYIGVFDIDFFLSKGDFYFCELNLRIGGSCFAITKMGVNLPGMMVKYLCGEKVNSMSQEINESAVFVNERMCLDDWYLRYIPTKEYHRIVNSSDISFIKDEDDIYPYIMYKKEYRKRQIKRIINYILWRKR